jgi:putative sigma-54 modulation protein
LCASALPRGTAAGHVDRRSTGRRDGPRRKGGCMNIEISGRHFDLSEGMKLHAREKLSVLERFYDGIDDVHVVLEFTAGTNQAHVQLRGDRVKLDARAKSHDMYAAFDETVANLERQLRRFKDRAHGHPHRSGQEQAGSAAPATYDLWGPAESSEFNGPVAIDNPETLPKFDTTAAMTEYETNGGRYLPFMNTETGKVNAVYRASSGASQVVELIRLGS